MTARPIPAAILAAAATLATIRPDLADLGLPALVGLAVSAA